jgi:hypothetical protein
MVLLVSSPFALYLTVELAAVQRDEHGVSNLYLGRLTQGRRSFGIPADGVASRQDAQRAQRLESGGRRPEPYAPDAEHLRQGADQPSAGLDQTSLHSPESATEIQRLEAELRQVGPPHTRAHGCGRQARQSMREFGRVPTSAGKSSRPTGEARAPLESMDRFSTLLKSHPGCRHQSLFVTADTCREFL